MAAGPSAAACRWLGPALLVYAVAACAIAGYWGDSPLLLAPAALTCGHLGGRAESGGAADCAEPGGTGSARSAGDVRAAVLDGAMVLDSTAKVEGNPDIRTVDLSKLVYPYAAARHGVGASGTSTGGGAGPARVMRRNDPSRPGVFLTYMLDYARCGTRVTPACFRVTNIALHVANAALVAWLAALVLRGTGVATGWQARWQGAYAGLLFLVAPVNWTTALYVYGRTDLLCGTFTFAAAAAAMQATQPPPCGTGGGSVVLATSSTKRAGAFAAHGRSCSRRGWHAASVACLVLGLCCKQTAVANPVLVAVTGAALWWRPRVRTRDADPESAALVVRRLALVAVDLACVAAVYMLARYLYFGGLGDLEAHSLPPVLPYWATQPYAVLRYLVTLLVPVGLAIDHHLLVTNMGQFEVPLGLLGTAAALSLASHATHRMGANHRRLALAAACWFLLCLAPFSVAPTVDVYVERRAYTASALVFVAVAHCCVWISQRLWSAWTAPDVLGTQRGVMGVLRASFLVVLVVLWAHMSHGMTVQVWGSSSGTGVWRQVLSQYPNSVRGLNNYATALMRAGRHVEAEPPLRKLLQLHPRDWIAMENLADVMQRKGDFAEAERLYSQVVAGAPDAAHPHFRLATLYHSHNQLHKAEPLYQRALALDPTTPDLHNNLALLYLHTDRYDEGAAVLQAGLRLRPDDRLLHDTRAIFELGARAA